MQHRSLINRRGLLQLGGLAGAAGMGVLPDRAGAAAVGSDTVRDRLWLWSHVAGSYNGQYGLPGKSRISPVEAAFYLSIPNIFMVQLQGRPEIAVLEQYAVPFQSLREVGWSIVDPQEKTPEEERRAVIDFAFKTPNITGVVMDDFFAKRKSWKPGQVADVSLEQLKAIRQNLQRGGKRLKLWVVLYEHQVSEDNFPALVPYLELCDVVQVWFWHGKNVPKIPATLDRVESFLPRKEKVLGCFMWDFGGAQPQPIPVMEQQCAHALKYIHEGRVSGMVLCGSWLCDRGLEAVAWTRNWIHKAGGQKV